MQARKAKKAAATTALKRPADSVKRGKPSKAEQLAKAEGGAAKVEKKPKAEKKIKTQAIEVSKKDIKDAMPTLGPNGDAP